jgi:hypothetical protein
LVRFCEGSCVGACEPLLESVGGEGRQNDESDGDKANHDANRNDERPVEGVVHDVFTLYVQELYNIE